jgi:hypothetical protein
MINLLALELNNTAGRLTAMAAGTTISPVTNGTTTSISAKPLQLSITLPSNPTIRIHLHLTILPTTLLLFTTTSSPESSTSSAALGSYVYAIPDRYNSLQPLSTPLYTVPSTLDFTMRMAKLLVRKTEKACYVSWSGNLSDSVMGGSVEEEMEAFRAVIGAVVEKVRKAELGGEEG